MQTLFEAPPARPRPMPTPRATVFRDGRAAVYRFERPAGVAHDGGLPLLLVPSLVNRWYVLDLYAKASVAGALAGAGIDTFCLDWGAAEAEDRHLSWDDLSARLARAVRAVCRLTGAPRAGVLGYSSGATL